MLGEGMFNAHYIISYIIIIINGTVSPAAVVALIVWAVGDAGCDESLVVNEYD